MKHCNFNIKVKTKKPVSINGVVYDSITAAARMTNISYASLNKAVNKLYRSKLSESREVFMVRTELTLKKVDNE